MNTTADLSSPKSQRTVFRQLRDRLFRNNLRVMAEQGRVRLITMLSTSVIVAALVFGLSLYAFLMLDRLNIPFKGMIVGGLFDLLFFTLGVMLLFSTGIILYASLFTAPEARYLLSTPARADQIFAAKFESAVMFSSWAFVILGLPIFLAYGFVAGVPWYFFVLLPLYLLGFVLLPGATSALICLLLVRYLPQNRRQALMLLILVGITIIGIWGIRTLVSARRTLMRGGSQDALEGFVGQFALAQHPAVPSHWMTNGLLAAARGEPVNALLPLAMIWSNGLLVFVIAAFTASRLYRTAYDRTSGGGQRQRQFRGYRLDGIMEALVFYLDRPTRILVVKDFRTFRRDPSQWVILIIFGGLMLLGAFNFRQYYNADLDTLDKYIVGVVNVAGTSVLLCAGLSRFIFPLISLEGSKFWILGLLPISRKQILRGKFAFAVTGSLLISELLVIVSDLLLNIPLEGIAIHACTAFAVAIGLSGLNVGLGAAMPNFRETDPSKIVVGFSGTVNMVVGLLFVVCTVTVMAVPLHIAAVMRHFQKLPAGETPLWVYAGVPVGLLFAALAAFLPLRAGVRSLERTEF
ncbi:MAG: putative ABC transporter permease subunit [Gemmataceae bacterium]